MSNVVNCTQEDLDQGVVCLTRGQSIGLTLDSAAGFISLGALVIAFVWLFVSHDISISVTMWIALTFLLSSKNFVVSED